ncbi:MAG: O-antigen ligase family protein [Candidatus Rokubacteria bacterium]|nr:O-antigen ligase family protein [Candidatus Rokubacteria bacterium]
MPLLLLMILIMPFETNPHLKLADSFLVFPDFTVIKLLGMIGFAWATLRIAGGDGGGSLWSSPQARLFVVFYAGVLFAGALSGSGLLPISRYLAFLLFLPFVASSVRTHEDLRRVVYTIALTFVIVFPYAFRQSIRYDSRLGTGLYETNYFAANLVLVIPLAFAIARLQSTVWRRRLWFGAGLVLVLELLLTASRGGFLGLVVAASMYAYRRRGLLATVSGLVVIIVAALILPTGLAERAVATLDPTSPQPPGLEQSNRAHIALFWAGLRMIADAPFTGVGPENFKSLSVAYAPDLGREYIAHNSYLELAAELGLPVLAVFLLMVGQVLRTFGRATRVGGDREGRELAGWAEGLRSGLVGFMVSGAFISAQYEKMFWMVVFVSIVLHRMLPARDEASAPAAAAPEGRALEWPFGSAPSRFAAWLLVPALVALPGAALAQPGGLTALPTLEPAANVLKNPGFEGSAGKTVDGWRVTLDDTLWALATGARSGQAALRLANAGTARYVPAADQVVTLEAGYYVLEGWVKSEGLGGASDRTGVRLCLDGRPRINWWHCTPIARGTSGWTRLARLAIPVEDAGTYRVTAGAYGRPDGTAWFDDVVLAPMKRPPVESFLLYPNYRGMLFDDRPQTVRIAVAVHAGAAARPSGAAARPSGDGLGGARVRVSLVDESRGTVRARREHPATAAVPTKDAGLGRGRAPLGRGRAPLVVELDAASIPNGEYLVRTELVGADGREVFRHPEYRIVKAPARMRETLHVWYDEENVAYLHGKPAFILGLYNTSGYSTARAEYASGRGGWGNERIAQAPINMLINYWLGAAPIPALQTYMDDLKTRGIHYLQTVNFYYEDDRQYRKLRYPAARDGEDALNRWVGRTLASHPGLAGFYTMDERTAEMVPKVFRQLRELRRAAPGTVTYGVLGDGWQRQAPLWRDALDVMGLDPYPITKPGGDNNLAMVGDWTRLGQDAVMRSRPVWMVLQYFPLTKAAGWPSREELRTMSWMAIVEGAKGLFYWSFGARGLGWVKDPAEREQRWQDLVTVTKEIKALEPVLLAPDAPVVARESSGGAIRMLGKRMPDGTRYLFAYNTRSSPLQVTLTLTDPAREVSGLGPAASATGDATRLTGEGTILSDRFGPYEVKRYRLR